MAGVVVLDAGALIALYDGNDAHHEWARMLLTHTADDQLVMSALTYAEVLVRPTQAGSASVFDRGIAGLHIQIAEISEHDARKIAEIRASTALRMPDAVVVFEARRAGAAVATTDKQLAKSARESGLMVYSPEERRAK